MWLYIDDKGKKTLTFEKKNLPFLGIEGPVSRILHREVRQ